MVLYFTPVLRIRCTEAKSWKLQSLQSHQQCSSFNKPYLHMLQCEAPRLQAQLAELLGSSAGRGKRIRHPVQFPSTYTEVSATANELPTTSLQSLHTLSTHTAKLCLSVHANRLSARKKVDLACIFIIKQNLRIENHILYTETSGRGYAAQQFLYM